MFGEIAFALIFISVSSTLVQGTHKALEKKWPSTTCDLLSSEPVSYSTPSPINVDTKNAIKVKTSSPLVFEDTVLFPFTVTNTGHALEFFAGDFLTNNQENTFGGVLCNEIYNLYRGRFYVSDNSKVSSFTQIDGKGSPLTLSLIYFKKKYGTFDESLKHRDGLAIIHFQLSFSAVDNPSFSPVESIFNEKLREPGSFAKLPAALFYAWVYRLPFINGYYAYYGSYIDLETGKQYESAITILADRTVYPLSKRQFYNSFLKLKNKEGMPLVNRQPIHETGKRQIYKAQGLKGLNLLF